MKIRTEIYGILTEENTAELINLESLRNTVSHLYLKFCDSAQGGLHTNKGNSFTQNFLSLGQLSIWYQNENTEVIENFISRIFFIFS